MVVRNDGGRDVNFRKRNKRENTMGADFGGGFLGVFILAPQFQAATCHFNIGPVPTPDLV